MHILSTAAVLAEDAAAETSQVSPFVFGGVALGALLLALVFVLMIKVGD